MRPLAQELIYLIRSHRSLSLASRFQPLNKVIFEESVFLPLILSLHLCHCLLKVSDDVLGILDADRE